MQRLSLLATSALRFAPLCLALACGSQATGPSDDGASTPFVSVSTGTIHTCGLTPAGKAYCWGGNGGALGDGTTTERLIPVAVVMPAGVTFTSVSAGGGHSCGLTPAGEAHCWGSNGGALGDGATTDRLTPVAVAMPAGVTFASLDVGIIHTCGLTPGGAAYCWGYNHRGRVGDGTTTNRLTARLVYSL